VLASWAFLSWWALIRRRGNIICVESLQLLCQMFESTAQVPNVKIIQHGHMRFIQSFHIVQDIVC
jgi:hypothetical protein